MSEGQPLTTDELQRLMREPAYWRDKDPAAVKKVTDGFKALYGDTTPELSKEIAGVKIEEDDCRREDRSLEMLQKDMERRVPGTLMPVTRTELKRLVNHQRQQFLDKKPDMVNQPPHYADRKFETIDVLKDSMTPEEFRGFLKGNALKYLSREGRKPGAEEDLGKAQWYLDRLKEFDDATRN